jgi:hypothetical protein
MTDRELPKEQVCPRCGSPTCNDPDSKACSDNWIVSAKRRIAELEQRYEKLRIDRDHWEADHTHVAGLLEQAERRAEELEERIRTAWCEFPKEGTSPESRIARALAVPVPRIDVGGCVAEMRAKLRGDGFR